MGFLKLLRKVKTLVVGRPKAEPIVYSLPNAAVYRKFFNQDEFFDAVDWSDWIAVIDGFERRFDKWYFAHMSGGHAAYVDLCALCALIDVFSLYQSQKHWHSPGTYKEFLRKLDPVFRRRLHTPTSVSRLEPSGGKVSELRDVADVFYAGVRCSLHHHGDIASYAGMSGTGQLAREFPSAGRSLCRIYSYSLVVFDPGVLKDRLRLWLTNYCNELRLDPNSGKATAFKARLRTDFGVLVP